MSRINVANFRHPDGTSDNINLDDSGRVLVGTSTARTNFFNTTLSAALQVEGTGNNTSTVSCVINSTSSDPIFTLARSRGTSVGSNTIVQSGDTLGRLIFQGSDGTEFVQAASIGCDSDGTPGANDMPGRLVFSTTADGATVPTEAMRIDSSQNLRFNSGYGSVATAYGVRAWVNFNASGTLTVRGSGNISSVTDNGVGQFAPNFTNAMPDTNYAGVCSHNAISGGNDGAQASPGTTSAGYVQTGSAGAWRDPSVVCVAFFR